MLDGDRTGCVCLHGFTASPEEMRWLAEHLHARGMSVFVPRLAGHGTRTEMMARQHWHDWYESALDGIALLRARCDRVFAAGLSMGGLLSLRLAAAGEIDAAAVLAAPLVLNSRLMPYARLIKRVRRYRIPVRGDFDERVRAIQRDMGREDYGRVAYDDRTPVASIAQLYDLMAEVRRCLSSITIPLLLIYSKADQTVPFDNLRLIADGVRSRAIVQHTLEHSDHVLTQDIERDTVYGWVADFFAGPAGQP